jgi:hypothetical protein
MSTDEYIEDGGVSEKSVAVAFRDCQWMVNPRGAPPQSFISLDSIPEKVAGDAIVPLRNRYFIFEMKGGRERIKSEWRQRNGLPSKAAHRTCVAVLRNAMRRGRRLNRLCQSMAGHFFLYWAPTTIPDQPDSGTLMVESYIAATVDLLPLASEKQFLDRRFAFGVADIGCIGGQGGGYDEVARFSAFHLLLDRIALLSPGEPSTVVAEPVGLTALELEEYIKFLRRTAREKDAPIRAMVTSGDGSFMRFVSSFSELGSVFSPIAGPQGSALTMPTLAARHRYQIGQSRSSASTRRRRMR